jgi:hypothetical protein
VNDQTTDYDTDVVTWSEHQAELLRGIAAGGATNETPDWINIIEEIEAVGASERRSLASHVRIIIEHLLKLDTSPAADPRNDWQDTILRARADIDDILEASPSLRPTLDKVVERQMPKAVRLAQSALTRYGEAPRVPLELIQYTTDQVTGDWLPDR